MEGEQQNGHTHDECPEGSASSLLILKSAPICSLEPLSRTLIRHIIQWWIKQPKHQGRTRKHPVPHRSINDLSAEQREANERKLWILLDLLARTILYGRVTPAGVGIQAEQQLGVKQRQREILQEKLEDQIFDHPNDEERWGECLLDNRGRPKGSYTKANTEEHELALRLSLSHRIRQRRSVDGSTEDVELEPGIDIPEDVFELVRGVLPKDHPSIDTIRRRVQHLQKEAPAYYKLLTEGEAALRRDDVPKMLFEVDEIDETWSWDACEPGHYIQHDGVKCTVVLLQLLDAKTDYKLHQELYPKQEKDESGTILGCNFTQDDVAVFLVVTMRKLARRPRYLHNDNDSRFKGLRERLPDLTAPGETPIEMHPARVEEPWGKGLTEVNFGRRQRKFFQRIKGKYNKRNRNTIGKTAKLSELPTLAKLRLNFRAFYNDLNTLPRVQVKRGKENQAGPSRAELYEASVAPLPCPPIRRLYNIMPPKLRRERWVRLDDIGFDFAEGGEKHWKPTVAALHDLPELYLQWMNANITKQPCHFFAIKLPDGWIGEICLGETWFEVIPRSKRPYSSEQLAWARDVAIERLHQQIQRDYAADKQRFLEIYAVLPEQLVATVRGTYQLPEGDREGGEATTSPEPENGNDASQESPKPVRTRAKRTDPIADGWEDLF